MSDGQGDASGRATDSRAGDASGRPGDGRAGDARAANAQLAERAGGIDGNAGDAKLGDTDGKAKRASDRRASDAKTDDARASGKRTAGRESGKRKAPGILYIEAKPWSWVTVDVETRETPARFSLPPGVHIVKFYNEENGLTKYEKIVVESDKTQKFTEDMTQ